MRKRSPVKAATTKKSSASQSSAAAIAALVDSYQARGVFRAAAAVATRADVTTYRIVWFQNQAMTLEVSFKTKQVKLIEVLPTIPSRSLLDRELRAWLQERSSSRLPAHRRIDPARFAVKLSNRKGRMELTIQSRTNDLEQATRKLLHLTNELYLEFLAAPERYDWIVETFGLDPDNPQWP